jgi:tRNA A37 methylthiotransferase MiaB
VIDARHREVADLALLLNEERAAERVGEQVEVLLEGYEDGAWVGRTAGQGPDDGATRVLGSRRQFEVGDIIRAVVTDSEGIDLVADPGAL